MKKGKVNVTLEGEKLVLKLENAELTAPYDGFPTYMLESTDNEITIQLQGVCTITQLSEKTAIVVSKGIILGRNADDKLLVKGGDVYFSKIIRNCTVEIEKGLEGNDRRYLEIDNAVVKAKFIKHADLTLKNCSILEREGARYDATKKEVVDKDGNTAENVVIGLTVTGVKLAYNNLTLKTGDSFTLLATVEPANATNKAVTWSSDNDAVATVSEAGVVEAKAVGTANIKVTTQDGSFEKTCLVTVTADDIPLTGLKVSPAETHIKVGQAGTLNVRYEPVTATHKEVTWATSDATIVTVDQDGNIKGIAVGEAIITVKSKQDETIKGTCKVIVDPATGVEDAVFANVIVSPNPFDTQLRISNSDVRGRYALYNTQGVVVAFGSLEGAETRINTTSLPAGMYLLRLMAENGATKTFTVVKR